MPVLRDLRRFSQIVSNLYRQRQAGKTLMPRLAAMAPLEPGTIDVVVYFADDPVNLYQIRQWYAPLKALQEAGHGVAVISRNAHTASVLLDECPVPVVYARKIVSIERFVAQQPARIVLYVNQFMRNFQMFRYGQRWHVFINHGESDKSYMVGNQFKAYDYAFVAGQAALDRLGAALWDYDLEKRAIPIGRPQADHFAGELPYTPDGRLVVLYAPTWEGDRPSMSYGSVSSHGEKLVAALVRTGRHRVIFRPHPRSGINDRRYAASLKNIVAMLEEANRTDPGAQHVYDTGGSVGWQIAAADVAITDISAMVYDRLATGKAILVTRPAAEDAVIDERGYLGAAEWLTAERAGEIVEEVERVLSDRSAAERLAFWTRHHFGDTTPGAATQRFHGAIAHLLAEWDRHSVLHPDQVAAAQERRARDHERWQEKMAARALGVSAPTSAGETAGQEEPEG